MFYLTQQKTDNYILINRNLDLLTYTLVYKNKDEFNIEYSFDLLPMSSNERYSVFQFDTTINILKEGSYKFFIYEGDNLIYNDLCFVNFISSDVKIEDDKDKKIIIT